MGTITDKINYLSGTKSQLKDMINYGLDEENKITSSTTFRNYVSSLFNAFLESLNNPNTLFNNLPKITGSGSNITLNNTANAPMRIMLNATDITQDGTPTPDSPQDIHTISGSNKVVVSDENGNSQEADIDLGNLEYSKIGNYEDKFIRTSGKNLFDYTLIPNAPTWESYSYSKYIELNVKPNTQYTASSNVPYNENGQIYFNGSSTDNRVYANKSTTITSDSTGKIFLGFFTNRDYYNDIVSGKYYVMLNEGTTALDYEPYGTDEWYLKKNINKVVLDGVNNVFNGVYGERTNGYVVFLSLLDSSHAKGGISDKFTYSYVSITNMPLYSFVGSSGAETTFSFVLPFTITSLAEANQWLENNNTTIYYVSNTPTYTQITGTLAEQLENIYKMLKSYKGQTNISQVNNDLSFELSVQAIEEL